MTERHDKEECKMDLRPGDVLNVLRNGIDDGLWQESIDTVVTSPPYNLGKNYGDGISDRRKPSEYLDWVDDWLRLIKVCLAPGGSLFLNIGGSPSKPMTPLEVLGVARNHFVLQNTIHWVKSVSLPGEGGKVRTVGHFKPINSERFLNDTHEYIFHLTHRGDVPVQRKAEGVGVPYSDESNVKRWAHTGGNNLRCRGNVWLLPYRTIRSRDRQRPHPATFPVTLAERCLRLHGDPGTVMDPFMGLGTTGIASKIVGARSFVGIDVNRVYVTLAERNIRRGSIGEDPADDLEVSES